MPEYVVEPGDVWMAEERVFYIIGVVRMSFINPILDTFDFLEISKDRVVREQGHLTIRSAAENGFHDLWVKVA